MRGIRVAASAIVLAGLAGCSSVSHVDGVPHGQLASSTPPPTPAPSPHQDPPKSTGSSTSAASTKTSATFAQAQIQQAYAAATAYFTLGARARTTLNTSAYDAAVTTSCPCRTSVDSQVAALQQHGWRMKNGGYTNVHVFDFAASGSSSATVSATHGIAAGDVVDASGKVHVHQPAYSTWQVVLDLALQDGRWKVAGVTTLQQGKPLP